MRISTTTVVVLVLLVSVSSLFICPPRAEAKVHVHITNNLTPARSMDVHCQSHDDDLGHHLLQVGEETSWSFAPNFWGSTLFWCEVEWAGGSGWVHFDAYDQPRDGSRCNRQCLWSVAGDGLLLGYDETLEIWQMFSWKHQ
uniref:S-protein homolog n=1 Tax=Kalanchoe fedtschenkoi TaxID=63787 RepID=A0A7N0VJ46_KALFE